MWFDEFLDIKMAARSMSKLASRALGVYLYQPVERPTNII